MAPLAVFIRSSMLESTKLSMRQTKKLATLAIPLISFRLLRGLQPFNVGFGDGM